MFSRKKKDKDGHDASTTASSTSRGVTPRGVTPRGGGGSTHATPRGVDQEAFRRLRELLEGKCDEVDDLNNNLKLAKESLRHLSDRLDKASNELEQSKEREAALSAENAQLRLSLSHVEAAARQKLEIATSLEKGIIKLQEGLDQGAERIKCDKAELQKRMTESAQELNRREHRIHCLTTGPLGDSEAGPNTKGGQRVQVRRLDALLGSDTHRR